MVHSAPQHAAPHAPKPSQATEEAPLDRIGQSLSKIEQRLEKIEAATAPKPSPESQKEASRATVAATFALAGFKLGAFFLGKIGFLLGDHPRAYMRGGFKAVGELWSNMVTFGGGKKPEHLVNDYKFMAVGLATGSILGPILAGWIGWTRGNRLEKPSDLFTHPIDSLNKIFASKPPLPPTEAPPEAPLPATHPHAVTERHHHGTVAVQKEKLLA